MQPMKTNRSFLLYLLLSIITCGIYEFYFVWTIIRDTNELCREDGKETPGLLKFILLSIVTCGIYAIIWWYNVAERLNAAGIRNNVDAGVSGNIFLICLLISVVAACGFASLYAIYLIIRALNRLSEDYNARNFGTSDTVAF